MADPDPKEIRDEFAHDQAEWKDIRDEADIDMRYVAGDPWEPDDRRAREEAKRPVLSADELGQYVNQVVNEVRSNKRGVKFTPVGDGANDQTAQFYADKMREIEYRSRAQIAYTVAFQNAVERGFGYVRVTSSYLHPKATFQDLTIAAIPNPNLVTPDPYALMPDLSDMQHCWVREKYSDADYNRAFESYKLDPEQKRKARVDAADWMTDDGVFVGEYWCIKRRTRKLLTVSGLDPRADTVGVFEDEYQPELHGQVLQSREVEEPYVQQLLTNGLEVFHTVDWPGKYIPIVSCFGKVLYVRDTGVDKKRILSMVRLGRDPQMLYAYLLTTEAETVSAIPKFPYFIYEGQLSPAELQNLTNSVTSPVPVVKVKPAIDGLPPGNGPLPFPQRNPYTADALGGIEMAKESARRAIQAAMGQSPLPTAAIRRNDKSGVALKQIEESGQKGAYHFTDHYLDMITQVGVIIEDLMSKVIDTPRDVPVRGPNDEARTVRVNDDSRSDSLKVGGSHQVTVSTGPSFESERDAASEFADTFVTSNVMQLVGPEKGSKLIAQAIKLKNLGPIGDEMAETVSPTPPKPDQMPTPEQFMQMLEQQKAQMAQMQQVMQQMKQAIDTDAAKQQATIQKAQIDAATELQRVRIEALRDVQIQKMKATNALALARMNNQAKAALQDDAQAHEMGLGAAVAAFDERALEREQEMSLQSSAQEFEQTMQSDAQLFGQQMAATAQDAQQEQAAEQQRQAGAQQLSQQDAMQARQLAAQQAQAAAQQPQPQGPPQGGM